jgi:hypothetical protein
MDQVEDPIAAAEVGVQQERRSPLVAEVATARADPLGTGRPLIQITPRIVPVLKCIAEQTWPARTYVEKRRRLFLLGPEERIVREGPPRYRIILRRYDLGTLRLDWRLEANGPMELLDWDDSGRVEGAYGFRYETYTIRPVYDEIEQFCGFGVNCRLLHDPEGVLHAVDARIDCSTFVHSRDIDALAAALMEIQGRPRVEEGRPGYAPTHEYAELIRRHVNKRAYFLSYGVNAYVSPGWTAEGLEQVFADPRVRAVRLAT